MFKYYYTKLNTILGNYQIPESKNLLINCYLAILNLCLIYAAKGTNNIPQCMAGINVT